MPPADLPPLGAAGRWPGDAARRRTLWQRLTPPQLFAASFLALVVAGTIGFRVLPGLHVGPRLSWMDALFTATSAVCVTGLVVVDTATRFTTAGQAYILLLIQLGGLGIIAFTSLIILALGRRLSLRHERLSGADLTPRIPVERLARDVVLFTFGIEAVGALALWLAWGPRMGWGAAVWPAVFHSISAFCNAGFSTFSTSLIGFQEHAATLLIVGALVVLGGIGFLTMEEIVLAGGARRGGTRRREARLSVHSRLVLAGTATLLGVGWVLFALFEWEGVLRALGPVDRVINALFLSITPRTAGYNSIDYTQATDSTNFLTILLMFVGGSPGSTAGGIKTTTLALIVLLAADRLRGRETTDVHDRTIPKTTIERAVGLSAIAFAMVTVAIFLYTWTEQETALGERRFLIVMFEAVSAFNTVGLSMNATPLLSEAGKLLTTALMYLGRVGPLTIAAALTVAPMRRKELYRYAREDVVVG